MRYTQNFTKYKTYLHFANQIFERYIHTHHTHLRYIENIQSIFLFFHFPSCCKKMKIIYISAGNSSLHLHKPLEIFICTISNFVCTYFLRFIIYTKIVCHHHTEKNLFVFLFLSFFFHQC